MPNAYVRLAFSAALLCGGAALEEVVVTSDGVPVTAQRSSQPIMRHEEAAAPLSFAQESQEQGVEVFEPPPVPEDLQALLEEETAQDEEADLPEGTQEEKERTLAALADWDSELTSKMTPSILEALTTDPAYAPPRGETYLIKHPVRFNVSQAPPEGAEGLIESGSLSQGDWIPAAVIDGADKSTWGPDAAIWSTCPEKQFKAGANTQEIAYCAKAKEIKMTFVASGAPADITYTLTGEKKSLKDLFTGPMLKTMFGRAKWDALVSGTKAQPNCGTEGFQVKEKWTCRFGMIGNQENDCKTPDSAIGIGCKGSGKSLVAGVELACCPLKKTTPAVVTLMIKSDAICAAHKCAIGTLDPTKILPCKASPCTDAECCLAPNTTTVAVVKSAGRRPASVGLASALASALVAFGTASF